jgi:hypothetical protein
MTPGQALLAIGIAAAMGVGAVAAYRGRWGIAQACLALVWAMVLTRVFKHGLPADLQPVAWAALWIAAGGWVMRAGMRDEARPVAVAGGFCIVSGFAYALAWVMAAETVILSPAMFAADMAVVAALVALAWGATGGSRDRSPSRKRPAAVVPALVPVRRGAQPDRVVDMAAGSASREGEG